MSDSTSSIETNRLRIRDGAHLQLTPEGTLQIFWEGVGHSLSGIPADLARAVATHLTMGIHLAELVTTLANEWSEDAVRTVVGAIDRTGSIESLAARVERAKASRVALFVNGELGALLEKALSRAGASIEKVAIRSLIDASTSKALEVLHHSADGESHASATDVAAIEGALARAEVAICALERVTYATLFAINAIATKQAVPCIFVGIKDDSWAFVGPVVTRMPTPCFACVELSTYGEVIGSETDLAALRSGSVSPDLAIAAARVLARAVDWTMSLLGADEAKPLDSVTRFAAHSKGETTSRSFLTNPRCETCRSNREKAVSPTSRVEIELLRATATDIAWKWQAPPTAMIPPGEAPYRTVGIVGGGTAGYLTALAFRALRPELDVSLIESSSIPVIGVGEATTPELVKFLHGRRFLNRPIDDFYRRVRPTWKLGINFEWGQPAPYRFTFPFQRGRLLESIAYGETLEKQSLGAMLMANDRSPVFKSSDGSVVSMIHMIRWAYHLDNQRFVRYLGEEAKASGVHHIDAKVTGVRANPSGEGIDAIVLDGNDPRSFDLYVDCSGFQSLLLGKALETPYQSYGDTLFTDRAVAFSVPNHGLVRPYTLAETMNSGWCWRIPFEDEDHRGYVFSSKFVSDDEAIAEAKAKNPRMGEARAISFRSGRYAQCWRGNVVAVGNAYGFVEPLESTAIHMIVQQLELLTTHLPASRGDVGVKEMVNRRLGEQWDRLRWFLGCHYRFNRRLDTPFWQAARNDTNVSGAEERIRMFQERAPLSYRSSLSYKGDPPDFFADDHSFDTILLGQKVPAHRALPVEDLATWKARVRALEALAGTALPQSEAIRWLIDERPDVLADFRSRSDSWIHSWSPA